MYVFLHVKDASMQLKCLHFDATFSETLISLHAPSSLCISLSHVTCSKFSHAAHTKHMMCMYPSSVS